MTLPYDATFLLQRDGVQIIDAARRTGLDADVPSCEGWAMRDLLWHVSEVWTFWGFVASQGATQRSDFDSFREPAQVSDGLMFDWAATALNGLHAALTSTPPTTEVWTWTGSNRDVWWVRRRMAQETAVHRWDAERVVGDPYEIWSLVAADGIDEFLSFFTTRGRGEELGGTVHLHCTDTTADENGEWMIHHLDGETIEVERAHGKADTAIRGTANDLLLWLWGRDHEPVEILGDQELAQRFSDGSDLA